MIEVVRKDVDALGRRLERGVTPSADDLAALAALQDEYQRRSADIGRVLAELVSAEASGSGLAVNSRTKTVGTIVEKLRRGTRLSTMQDVVGYRVSASPGNVAWSLADQDQFVAALVARFPGAKVVDRRERPSAGYRAVHLVVDAEGCPVEVQVRTYLQDRWANETEALADRWGRGIRYGLPPDGANAEQIDRRAEGVAARSRRLA